MDPPELIFLKNLDPQNLFFRKKGWNIWTPMKRLDPLGTYFSKDSWKIWTPWNLFFKRQLKNMDPMELEIWNPFGLVTWELVRTNLYIANLKVKRNSTNWVKKVKKIVWMYYFKMKNIWYNTTDFVDVQTLCGLHSRKLHETTSCKCHTGLSHQAG